MQILQPPDWAKPKGYSNGIVAKGRLVFVAARSAGTTRRRSSRPAISPASETGAENIVAILAEAGARPEHICRMNWYVGDAKEYNASLKELGAAYREVIGRTFPVMTALQVAGFVEAERNSRSKSRRCFPSE